MPKSIPAPFRKLLKETSHSLRLYAFANFNLRDISDSSWMSITDKKTLKGESFQATKIIFLLHHINMAPNYPLGGGSKSEEIPLIPDISEPIKHPVPLH